MKTAGVGMRLLVDSLLLSSMGALLPLLVAGCGGSGYGSSGNTPPPNPTITSVAVACSPASIVAGATSSCTATVTGTGSYSSAVAWAVSPANMGTVSSTGVFMSTASGSATITATSSQDSTKSGSATVTVAVPPPTIAAVSVTCAPASVQTGQTSKCAANVTGTGSYSSAVTWSVDNGSIDQSGNYTAPSTPTTATVKATSNQDATRSGTASITVKAATALTVLITDLPSGTPGSVTVTDPNGHQMTLTSSQTIYAIPGAYTLTAVPVAVGSSTYHATQATQTATVTSGNTTTATVDYYDVVPNTTKVLDAPGMESLTFSQSGTTLTLSSASAVAQSLTAGDVLVSAPAAAAPNGLLVNVLSVANGGNTVTVTASPATMEQAIQRADFDFTQVFGPNNVQSIVNYLPGLKLLTVEQARQAGIRVSSDSLPDSCSGNPNTFVQPLSYTFGQAVGVSQSGDNGGSQGVGESGLVQLSGAVEFCPKLQLKLQWGFLTLNSLTAISTFGEHAQLTVEGNLTTSLHQQFDAVDIKSEPVFVVIGGVPVVLQGDATLFVGFNAAAIAGFYASAEQDAQAQAGLIYANGQTTPISSATSAIGPGAISLDGSIGGKGYAGIKLGVLVYGSVLPNIAPVAYLKWDSGPPSDLKWGLEGTVGVDLSIIDTKVKVSLDSPDIQLFEQTLWTAPSSSSNAPSLSLISPSSVIAGIPELTLTLTGSNFVPDSVVSFSGTPLATYFTDPGDMTAVLPASDLAIAGSYQVTVTNPDTAGATSNPLPLTVASGTGMVTVSPVSATVPEGGVQTFSVSVSGGGGVNWSVREGAAGGVITSAGIYTAPNAAGTFHIVATSMADTSQTAVSAVSVVSAPIVATLHSFDHATGGAIPWASFIQGSDGNLYGTTETGGNLSCAFLPKFQGCGTVFKMDVSGNVTELHSFGGQDGIYPVSHLTQTTDGSLYGTTSFGGGSISACDFGGTSIPGGCGTIFKIDTSENFAQVYSFSSFTSPLGVGPDASLLQAADGTLYGATAEGGNTGCSGTIGSISYYAAGCGNIFKLSTTGVPVQLYTFAGQDGAYPNNTLMQAADGNFYGVTSGGGNLSCSSYASPGCGTVFRMTANGGVSTLHSFSQQDGAFPYASLIQATDGNFYGTTLFGGSLPCAGGAIWQGCGTVFKIDAVGVLTTLHSFSGPDGAYPARLVQASDGDFYGTTESGGDANCAGRYGSGCGIVFRMDASGNVTVLYAFTGESDGSWPESGVIQGTDGNLYGTAAYGGTADDGVAFRLSNLHPAAASISNDGLSAQERTQIIPISVKHVHVGLPAPGAPGPH